MQMDGVPMHEGGNIIGSEPAGRPNRGDGVVLEALAVCKSFGGITALSDVDFDLRAGEVHALVG